MRRVVHYYSCVSSCHPQRLQQWRYFRKALDERDEHLRPRSLLQILGFPDDQQAMQGQLPSAIQIKRHYFNRLAELEERQRVAESLETSHDADDEVLRAPSPLLTPLSKEVDDLDAPTKLSPAQLEKERQRLASAFHHLTDATRREVYAKFGSASIDDKLGLVESDSPWTNADARHKQFIFSETVARPLADSRRVYEKIMGWDATDQAYRDGLPRVGTDIEHNLSLTFDEALHGCTKQVSYARNVACKICRGQGRRRAVHSRCTQCHGRGQVELPSGTYLIRKDCINCSGEGTVPAPECTHCFGKGYKFDDNGGSFTVVLEPGIRSGTVRVFKGQGNIGARGGDAGRLVVTVTVQEHSLFHVEKGDDHVHLAIPISLSVALLGGSIWVPSARYGGIGASTAQGGGTSVSVPAAKPATKEARGRRRRKPGDSEKDSKSEASADSDRRRVLVAIPPGTRSGSCVTITGHGLPSCKGKSRGVSTAATAAAAQQEDDSHGDMHIHFVVQTPNGDRMSPAQRRSFHMYARDEPFAQWDIESLMAAKQTFGKAWFPQDHATHDS